MDAIAGFITRVLSAPDDEAALQAVSADVRALCRRFPLYPTLAR
jgi:glycine/serine hydroxymethyltransferase